MDEMGELPGKFQLHRPLKVYLTVYTNAFAERWVRTVREECLDHILILNIHHLRRVLAEFSTYYNESRPHQGIEQQTPIPHIMPFGHQFSSYGIIHRRKILGGIINDYHRSPSHPALASI